ncbi:hypothetical protein Trydic_g19117 [Trypoxylus dichotomus]
MHLRSVFAAAIRRLVPTQTIRNPSRGSSFYSQRQFFLMQSIRQSAKYGLLSRSTGVIVSEDEHYSEANPGLPCNQLVEMFGFRTNLVRGITRNLFEKYEGLEISYRR